MKYSFKSDSLFLLPNFGWLGASHGANLIFPLVIYPYLIRIIGVEAFGMVIFAQAFAMFFCQFIDYGFSLSGIRDASIHRGNKNELSMLFSTVFYTKLCLLICGFFMYWLIVANLSLFEDHKMLFLSSYAIAVGQWLLPNWFIQGLEKMKLVAVLNISTKILFLLLILFTVHETSHSFLVNIWLGVSQAAVGLVGIGWLYWKFHLSLKRIRFHQIKDQIQTNFLLFASNFSAYAVSNSGLVVVGFVADSVTVGYYAIIERLLIILRAPAVLLYQTVYPRLCLKADESIEHLLKFSRAINVRVYLLFVPLAVAAMLLSNEIITLFAGRPISELIHPLYLISWIPLIAALNIPATQALLAFKLDKSYSRITVFSAAFGIGLTALLTLHYSILGTAVAALITEICVSTWIYVSISVNSKNYDAFFVLNWK